MSENGKNLTVIVNPKKTRKKEIRSISIARADYGYKANYRKM